MTLAHRARLHEDTVRHADAHAQRRRPYVRRAAPWRPLEGLRRDYRGDPVPEPVPVIAAPAPAGRGVPAGVHPQVWAHALRLARGDRSRLQVVTGSQVIVR